MKSWTVMMFMAGDNDLSPYAGGTLLEVKTVGSTDDVDIVAELDPYDAGVPTRRYALSQGSNLTLDVVDERGETNTGDPAVLTAFIQWATENYPAERRMLVIWNHGRGWDDSNLFTEGTSYVLSRQVREAIEVDGFHLELTSNELRRIVIRNRRTVFRRAIDHQIRRYDIAEDVTSRDSLTTADLQDALASARTSVASASAKAAPGPLDIIACDACYMAMIEVAYAIRDQGQYFVATENVFPSSSGWPYDRISAALSAKPQMSPKEVASMIVNEFTGAYGAAERVNLSAVLLSKTPAVVTAINGLADALLTRIGDSVFASILLECYGNTTRYLTTQNRWDYADLGDFCNELIQRMPAETAILDACAATKHALGECVLISKTSSVYDYSHGVSIYFPEDAVSPLYKDLEFAKNSTWPAFLAEFVKL